MAYKVKFGGAGAGGGTASPNLDAGYGLIYRLNDLWRAADGASLGGDMDRWNFVLDRIYMNLCYRGKLEIDVVYDDNKEPISIRSIGLPKEDQMVYDKFQELIKEIKKKKMLGFRKKNKDIYFSASEEHYAILKMKDIWLRKFMNERGLYLKESEFDPKKAMFGG